MENFISFVVLWMYFVMCFVVYLMFLVGDFGVLFSGEEVKVEYLVLLVLNMVSFGWIWYWSMMENCWICDGD